MGRKEIPDVTQLKFVATGALRAFLLQKPSASHCCCCPIVSTAGGPGGGGGVGSVGGVGWVRSAQGGAALTGGNALPGLIPDPTPAAITFLPQSGITRPGRWGAAVLPSRSLEPETQQGPRCCALSDPAERWHQLHLAGTAVKAP